MKKSTSAIRQAFLNFFYNKGHQIVPSSSLIPNNDPTLLFTNAGMNQFKDIFLGFEKRHYSRAVTSQYCIRAGGKHNDLKNVGYTAYHHTLFEMLGNFSFGDYFKYEAIKYAWELLTDENWFNIKKEHLWVTVYTYDKETYQIWEKEIGIPRERIICIGDNKGIPYISDNFWQMGDIGPCGPCTEILFNHSDHITNKNTDNKNGSKDFIEIWNIVFIQFNRLSDGTMEILPNPSVDTGMGLERIAAVLQCVGSSYETDLFRKLIQSIAQVIGITDVNNRSLRVIADHIRSCSFLIADGVMPSNENRGYVLRHIIRRAIFHGRTLGIKKFFLYKLVEQLIEVMDTKDENLKSKRIQIEQTLKIEEEKFFNILERGLSILDKELEKLSSNILNGETAFLLHDTYGFPIDLTIDVCQTRNIKVDKASFETAMNEQRFRARKLKNFSAKNNIFIPINNTSEFQGYDHLNLNNSKVSAILIGNKVVDYISTNQKEKSVIIILDKTPFYAESGGQVGDKGNLKGNSFNFSVNDTQKYGQMIGHIGTLTSGSLKVGDILQANVNQTHREYISINHSATHLIHAALRKVLGEHVIQKGSFINDKILHIDFLHYKAMTSLEIGEVENLVNTQIRRNLSVKTCIMHIDSAKIKGAIALFGEKYGEFVRVLSIGDFSIELCGGTHVSHTGEIGLCHITSEFGIASNVRRITAITGKEAIVNLRNQSNQLDDIKKLLKTEKENLRERIFNLLNYTKELEKEIKAIKEHLIFQKSSDLLKKVKIIKNIRILINNIDNIEPQALKNLVKNLKNQSDSIVIVLSTIVKNKIFLVSGVSKDIINCITAKELISIIIKQIDGKGGGCQEIAQVCGKNITSLSTVLSSIEHWIDKKLQ